MKKFAFLLAPLMAISFLTNCGSSKQYSVAVGTHDHLSFTATDGKDLSTIKATEGQDFKFKMKAENVSNDIEYVIPTALDIKIDDKQPLAPTFYTIIPLEGDKEADITIKGIKVVGNITISGSAAIGGQYNYEISNHDGLNIDVPSEGSKGALDNLVITFTPQAKESGSGTYAKPKAENILIQFDKVPGENPIQWVSPSEKDVSEFCTFNEGSGELTIKPKYIKNNIDIRTRSPNYPVLEKMTWKEIDGYSFSGYAPYIFYIGEEKTVKINNVDHKVRILGTNYDDLEKGGKAGITFEFTSVLIHSYWNNKEQGGSKAYDFINHSDLNECLQPGGALYNMMPNELIETYIKTVNKHVETYSNNAWHDTVYSTKLFPLSYNEMASNMNGCYDYYKNGGTKFKDADYWLRSRFGDEGLFANDFEGAYGLFWTDVWKPFGVAPAFCI